MTPEIAEQLAKQDLAEIMARIKWMMAQHGIKGAASLSTPEAIVYWNYICDKLTRK